MEIVSGLSTLATGLGEAMETQTVSSAADAKGGVPDVTPEAMEKLESALAGKAPGDTLAPVGNTVSPADLYQAQFAMSMFKLEGTGGSKGSQQLIQDVENVLKQQG